MAMIENSGLEVGIVISSDWRHGKSVRELFELFYCFEFSRRIIGKTTDKLAKTDCDFGRGNRIQQWLLGNHERLDINYHIILDDNPFDIEHHHADNFVHCNEGVFSEKNVEKAILILNAGLHINLVNVETNVGTSSVQNITHPVIIAAQLGHLEAIDSLISTHRELLDYQDACGQTPLFWATRNHHIHIVNFLVSKGANVNIASMVYPHRHCPPLFWALKSGFSDIAAALIEAGATIDTPFGSVKIRYNQGLQPVHLAAKEGLVDILKILLGKKIELREITDNIGQTSLIYAATHGHLPAVQFLLDVGANVHSATTSPGIPIHGRTALYWAIYNQHAEVARVLVKHHADINTVWIQALQMKDSVIVAKLYCCLDEK